MTQSFSKLDVRAMKKIISCSILFGLLIVSCFSLSCQSTIKGEEMKTKANNPVTWFSIPSDDMERAASFYKSAFGWQIEPLTKEKNDDFSYNVMVNSKSDEDYVSEERGRLNGCIVKRKIGLPTSAVLVEVENLDNAIEKVKQAGGVVVTDRVDMPTLGGMFVLIKDTEGNYVEVFQKYSSVKK